MQIAAATQINLLRTEARRVARQPMPMRLWRGLSLRWQLAADRRAERGARATAHPGVVADLEMAQRRR